MKNFLSVLAVSCLVLTACKSSGPGLPDEKSLETASSSQAPAVCPNEQPNTLGATRICLDAALNEGKFDYFRSQFAKAWQQGLLKPEDGHVFLLAALQQNQLELMRFLFDKGAQLQASEFPIVKPGRISDLPENFQQSGIVLKGKANPELLRLLLNGTQDEAIRSSLAVWVMFKAVQDKDNALLDWAKKNLLSEKQPGSDLVGEEYQNFLRTTAARAGNVQVLAQLTPEMTVPGKLQLLMQNSDFSLPVDLSAFTPDDFSSPNLKALLLAQEYREYPERLQKLLSILAGDNKQRHVYASAVRDLLQLGLKPQETPNFPTNPLMSVAGSENPDVSLLETLKQTGINLDARDVMGRTALFYAAEKGNAQVVDWLLAQGAKPSIKAKLSVSREPAGNEPGDSLLMAAVRGGNPDLVRRFLPLFEPLQEPANLIELASEFEHPGLVPLLVQHQVPVTRQAFTLAGLKRNSELFKALFDACTSEQKLQNLWETALLAYPEHDIHAFKPARPLYADPQIRVQELADSQKQESFLLESLETLYHQPLTQKSAWRTLPFTFEKLSSETAKNQLRTLFMQGLQSGLDPHQQEGEGSLLQGLASSGELTLMKKLLTDFPDLKSAGPVALETAAWSGQVEIAQFLLSQGIVPDSSVGSIDISLGIPELKSPLASALRLAAMPPTNAFNKGTAQDHEKLIDLLIPKTDLAQPDNRWLLFLAVQAGRLDLVKELARFHDVKLTNTSKENLLFFLDNDQFVEMAEYLVKQGLDINQLNQDGQTPLMRAGDLRHTGMMLKLIALGADPCLTYALNGQTAVANLTNPLNGSPPSPYFDKQELTLLQEKNLICSSEKGK